MVPKKYLRKSPIVIIALITGIVIFALYSFSMQKNEVMQTKSSTAIRFMPIGDSYTIGNGVLEHERWPNLLVYSLKNHGTDIHLIKNPAVSGYDAQDAIDRELPLFEKEKPDFATLFIGTNDSFRGRDLTLFRSNYIELITRMQAALTIKNNLVIITIPQYASFPGLQGSGITNEVIEQYNQIIREETMKRGLPIVDLFLVNSLKGNDFFISDGIHPNAQGIKVWHDRILPTVKEILE